MCLLEKNKTNVKMEQSIIVGQLINTIENIIRDRDNEHISGIEEKVEIIMHSFRYA